MNEKSNLNGHHLSLILEKQYFLRFIGGDKFIVTPEQDSYFIVTNSQTQPPVLNFISYLRTIHNCELLLLLLPVIDELKTSFYWHNQQQQKFGLYCIIVVLHTGSFCLTMQKLSCS